MTTADLLISRYGHGPLIPLEKVQEDYFPHLKPDLLTRRLMSGDIPLKAIRTDRSQKAPVMVHLTDLATYIDNLREV